MVVEDIIFNIFPVLFFGFKIRAGVINNLAAVKYQLQIPEPEDRSDILFSHEGFRLCLPAAEM